ncbi:hypothetical protein AAK873_08800 [Heminiphilus faecis]|uniref:Uncharacterized protein n=1 Tax=Heminiphilus faecis TaxID=2601703 RepID=A0ABV4D188_9BACT
MTINTIIYKKLGGAYASSRLRLYGYSRDTFVRGNPYRERPSTSTRTCRAVERAVAVTMPMIFG